MTTQPLLLEEEQNAIVLEIFDLATKRASDVIWSAYREDLVHDLVLECLEDLRGGLWDVPRSELARFVERRVRNRRAGCQRKRRRQLIRDRKHLEAITEVPREWMSQELKHEELRFRRFIAENLSVLNPKWVRAHRLVREDNLTYAKAAKALRVSVSAVHKYIACVQRAFRESLPSIGVASPTSTHGGRPAARARVTARIPAQAAEIAVDTTGISPETTRFSAKTTKIAAETTRIVAETTRIGAETLSNRPNASLEAA
jgi:DNA-directed RNA polymerase specialized sigma24 family protein